LPNTASQPTTIAVLEPDFAGRAVLLELLASAGYRAAALETDQTLPLALRELQPQLILAGPGAPQLAWNELVAEVPHNGASPAGPAVIVTGVADGAARAAALQAGAVAALDAGVETAELLAQVEAALRAQAGQLADLLDIQSSRELLAQVQADLELGAKIQQSFLPPLSIRTPAFALEARLQASWTLSGDFFDYKFITPERLAVFIADISGHGVASALLASRLKAFFDEHYRNARRPARTLEQLNRMLIELGEHQQFATAVMLCIDVSEGSLVYANAGHRTLYLMDREQGHYTALPSSGPALGLFEDCEIGERDFTFLPRRKRLIAYTDGLVEFKTAAQTGEAWVSEEQILQQLILPSLPQPTPEFADSLFNGSLELSGGHWEDDVCLVIVDC
jgi:sigma-B regulation protein RsbU (phosphoserine phosphatase)